jgi:hypothetical protein
MNNKDIRPLIALWIIVMVVIRGHITSALPPAAAPAESQPRIG